MIINVFKCFDSIVVISDVVRQNLQELFGITENVIKISNSVDGEKLQDLCKAHVDLTNKMSFTTLGRLEYNKNQILLLKATKIVKKQRDDFMVYVLGDGEDKAMLQRYIEENGLESNARILGFVENPYPYIKNSIATMLTSLSEGFSLALVESVMLNTPIISTDVGVAKELINNYHCGDLIGYDENELTGVLLRYLNKYDGYKDIFDIGNEYDVKSETRKITRLIEQTIQKASLSTKMKRLPYPEVTIQE